LVDSVCPDLGVDWLARRNTKPTPGGWLSKLEELGHTVVLDLAA
jgi:hypothetical protein